MLPCPMPCMLRALGHRAVGRDLCVDQGYIAVVRFRLFIHQGKNAGSTGACHNNGVDLLGKLVDITRELLCHIEKRHHNGNAECLAGQGERGDRAQQQNAADQRYQNIKHISEVADNRPENACIGMRMRAVMAKRFIQRIKILLRLFLMAKYLNDLLPAHHLLHKALGFCNGCLLADKVFCAAAADLLCDKNHQHHAKQHHKRQPQAVIQHNGEHAEHNGTGLNKCGEGLGNKLAQRIDIIGIKAHDIAVLMRIEIFDRQILHAVKHFAAHFIKIALRHIRHELCMHGDCGNGEQIQPHQNRNARQNLRFGSCPVAALIPSVNGFEHLLHENRRNGGNHGGKQNTSRRQRGKHRIISKQPFENAPQRAHIALWLSRCAGRGSVRHLRALTRHLLRFGHVSHLPVFAAYKLHCRSGFRAAAFYAAPWRRSARCPSPKSDRCPARRQCAAQ